MAFSNLQLRQKRSNTCTHTQGDLGDVGLLGYHDLRARKIGPGSMNLMTEMNNTHARACERMNAWPTAVHVRVVPLAPVGDRKVLRADWVWTGSDRFRFTSSPLYYCHARPHRAEFEVVAVQILAIVVSCEVKKRMLLQPRQSPARHYLGAAWALLARALLRHWPTTLATIESARRCTAPEQPALVPRTNRCIYE